MQGGRKVHKFGAKIFSPKSRSYRFQAIEEEGYTQLHSAIEVGDRDFVVAFVGQNNGSIMRQKVGVNLTWKTALVMLKHQKLGKCPGYTEFKDELKNVIYDSLDMVEFELRWNKCILNYKLQSNHWFAILYAEREMWVPAAMKDLFWAGMNTTQESIHSFFDNYLGPYTGLC